LIKIRYADLPAGLHVRTAAEGSSTVIYLRRGLTPAQRRAALVRARRAARLGYGPGLPTAGVAAAIVADRLKATVRDGATTFRAHPLLLLPPVIVLAGAAFVYVMLADVTITVGPPQAGGPYPEPGMTVPAPPHRRSSARPGDPAGPGDVSGPGPASGNRPGGGPARSPRPTRSVARSFSPLPSTSIWPFPSPPSKAPPDPPDPVSSATPLPSPSPSPSPSPLPSPSPSPSA
jgi:hypothetical protein